LEEENRQSEIHSKGFKMPGLDYNFIKVGNKKIEDIALDLNTLKKVNKNYNNKAEIIKALANRDVEKLREISNFFYNTNGIYFRVCNYFSQMYRYDWYIVDEVYSDKADTKKIKKEFHKILNYLDNSYIRKTCMDIALAVIKDGAYYGCLIPNSTGIIF